jgi:hypothetical protein
MNEKNKIKNIILDYCEGMEHLEFSKSDLPEMVEKIKLAILNELDDAEHLDDARGYVKEYL